MPDANLNPEKFKTALSKKSQYTSEDLFNHIDRKAMTTKELKDTMIQETGISKSLFYELLGDLKKMPGVTFNEQTKKWRYATTNEVSNDQE